MKLLVLLLLTLPLTAIASEPPAPVSTAPTLSTTLPAVEIPFVPEPVVIIVKDKTGELISVKRTNQLINVILRLNKEINYYKRILEAHSKERVQAELMFLREQGLVAELKRKLKK